jgi:hypothetical protein
LLSRIGVWHEKERGIGSGEQGAGVQERGERLRLKFSFDYLTANTEKAHKVDI